MTLPWVRLDANIASHDKILNLIDDPSPKRWQAAASYMFALGWAGGAGNDGHISPSALRMVHGTPTTARLLVKHGLWEEKDHCWVIHNFAQRQELRIVTEAKRAAQRAAARKTNCERHHGKQCGCWQSSEETA